LKQVEHYWDTNKIQSWITLQIWTSNRYARPWMEYVCCMFSNSILWWHALLFWLCYRWSPIRNLNKSAVPMFVEICFYKSSWTFCILKTCFIQR